MSVLSSVTGYTLPFENFTNDEQAVEAPIISIITPAYNEADNLPLLRERLEQTMTSLALSWEWIVVDDHSIDKTFYVVEGMATQNPDIRGIRFARNFGAHAAIACGLHQARGGCAVVMAADLQDPPETLPELLAEWRHGAQVVWAVRAQREGETFANRGFARLYYFLLRRMAGLQETPSKGADFFLIDRCVIDAFQQFGERNTSLIALITWMGFRQVAINYTKQMRMQGQSGWGLEKKLKLVADTITSFTYFPIRLMSYVGFLTAMLGFLYAGLVTFNALRGLPPQGWASLMVVVLIIGGIQMVMLGVLGEYLWRALDESRSRPRYLIEMVTESRKENKEAE